MKKRFINEAIKQSIKAYKNGDVPVGAVIVLNNKIIAKGYNKKHKNNISIDHPELIAIKNACKKIGSWRLIDCELYVTLEPCKMCYAAIAESRIKNIYYLVDSNYANAFDANFEKISSIKLVDENNYINVLKTFFKSKR